MAIIHPRSPVIAANKKTQMKGQINSPKIPLRRPSTTSSRSTFPSSEVKSKADLDQEREEFEKDEAYVNALEKRLDEDTVELVTNQADIFKLRMSILQAMTKLNVVAHSMARIAAEESSRRREIGNACSKRNVRKSSSTGQVPSATSLLPKSSNHGLRSNSQSRITSTPLSAQLHPQRWRH